MQALSNGDEAETRLGGNLDLLTAGRPNPDPIAALTSPRMRDLLTFAASIYDWVLVDTPPVALLPDSELLDPAPSDDLALTGPESVSSEHRQSAGPLPSTRAAPPDGPLTLQTDLPVSPRQVFSAWRSTIVVSRAAKVHEGAAIRGNRFAMCETR